MSSRTFAEPKRKSFTTFSPIFGKKSSVQIVTPAPTNDNYSVESPNFGHNFGDVQVESQAFKQSCSLTLSGPSHYPFGGACHTYQPTIQTKLKIGQPNDKYEQEADRVVEQVMRMPDPQSQISEHASGRIKSSNVQRKGAKCEEGEEEVIQTKSISSYQGILQRQEVPEEEEEETTSFESLLEEGISTAEVRPEGEEEDGTVLLSRMEGPRWSPESGTADRIASAHRGGRPLPYSARSFIAPRFGYDFSKVRVHTDDRSDQLSRELGAAAFTIGNNVFFRSGRFDPQGNNGRRLLAHELTHVVQQNGGHRATTGGTLAQRFPSSGPITPVKAKIQRQVEVHVNLYGKDTVRVYRKGKKTKKYRASAGKKSTPTKQGTFRLTKRKDATKKVGVWGLQYFATFKGGQGFHSTQSYPTRATACEYVHKKYCKSKSQLDQRVFHLLKADGAARSHGCVRLNPTDALKLFNMVSDGTTVKIYNEKTWKKPSWAKKKPVKKPSSTKPGSKQKVAHKVVKGDTLSEIAQKYGVSEEAIIKANPGKIRVKDKMVKQGDTIKIPSN